MHMDTGDANTALSRARDENRELRERRRSGGQGVPNMEEDERAEEAVLCPRALICENMDTIATAIVLEQGKTFPDAQGDVRGLQVVETACTIHHAHGRELPSQQGHGHRDEEGPVGRVRQVRPFPLISVLANEIQLQRYATSRRSTSLRESSRAHTALYELPFHMLNASRIPLSTIHLALVAGNALLIKPSESDPARDHDHRRVVCPRGACAFPPLSCSFSLSFQSIYSSPLPCSQLPSSFYPFPPSIHYPPLHN
ncbi:hypothetical protein K438DRAFT_1118691 [Mycena galopus ATCC 62051]|nr:hypothetical protein K438DRAFT_1118691 [Mycena galopus ATCC 62051]